MNLGSDAHTPARRDAPTRAPRPRLLRIDAVRCTACATCEAFVPGWLEVAEPIPMSSAALDAMAACPTGAIVWVEPGAGNTSRAHRAGETDAEGPEAHVDANPRRA